MRRDARWAMCGLLGCAVVLAACGSSKTATPQTGTATTVVGAVNPNAKEALPPGDIPDGQVYVAYAPTSGGYTISYPQGWAQRQAGTTSTFSQNFNSVEVSASKAPKAPTAGSAGASDVVKLRSLPGFKLVKIDTVIRASGPAIRLVYEVTSATDQVTGKTVTLDVERYLFWHKGTLITITLSSPKGSDNVDPWKAVTDSLVWK